MIIKAGTYRFKTDLLPLLIDNSYPQKFIKMRYTVSPITFEGVRVSTDNVFDGFFVGWTDDLGDSVVYQTYTYYNSDFSYFTVNIDDNSMSTLSIKCIVSDGAWYGDVGIDVEMIIPTFGQTINILEDFTPSDVDEEAFSTWFTENTTMLIKAGTYKWNDTISNPISFIEPNTVLEVSLPFNIYIGEETLSFVTIRIGQVDANRFVISYVLEGGTVINAYTISGTWEDFLQNITTTYDIYVPTNFGLWANDNWQEYSEEAPKRKFTRLYIGNTVASSGGKCFKRLTREEPKITDLTGTTWYVPSGWSATAGYGIYKVYFLIPEKNANTIWDELSLGYASRTYGKTTEANSICCLLSNSDRGTITSSSSFTITITGGTDVTNPDIIAWLSENGELQ